MALDASSSESSSPTSRTSGGKAAASRSASAIPEASMGLAPRRTRARRSGLLQAQSRETIRIESGRGPAPPGSVPPRSSSMSVILITAVPSESADRDRVVEGQPVLREVLGRADLGDLSVPEHDLLGLAARGFEVVKDVIAHDLRGRPMHARIRPGPVLGESRGKIDAFRCGPDVEDLFGYRQ